MTAPLPLGTPVRLTDAHRFSEQVGATGYVQAIEATRAGSVEYALSDTWPPDGCLVSGVRLEEMEVIRG